MRCLSNIIRTRTPQVTPNCSLQAFYSAYNGGVMKLTCSAAGALLLLSCLPPGSLAAEHEWNPAWGKTGRSPGMLQNLVTGETFQIRGGLIHEVEVFPL
jgi:hypothetical protein